MAGFSKLEIVYIELEKDFVGKVHIPLQLMQILTPDFITPRCQNPVRIFIHNSDMKVQSLKWLDGI